MIGSFHTFSFTSFFLKIFLCSLRSSPPCSWDLWVNIKATPSFFMPCFLTQSNLECCESKWAVHDLPSHVDTGLGFEDPVLDSRMGLREEFLESNWVLCAVGNLTWIPQSRVGKHQPHMKYRWVDSWLNQAGLLLTSAPSLLNYMTLENPW